MDNACIIGYGVVGMATAQLFGIEKRFDIREDVSNITLEQASKCRYIFICLPTPVDNDGNYQLDAIKKVIGDMENFGGGGIYIIRSTVFPGFAMGLQKELNTDMVISNPEFLSEDTALEDTKSPPFIIIGGLSGIFRDEVKAFYEARIKSCPIMTTDNTTAEMIKLSMNAYFATKVIFANQLYDACQKIKANYETVKDTMERHPFGPKNHFVVWYKGKRGVNGHCLPKDSKAFANYANSDLLKKVTELNQIYSFIKDDNDI